MSSVRPPTERLPPEVLSTIFGLSLSPPTPHSDTSSRQTSEIENQYFLITLGAVCTHWRHVTWSSSLLWRNFTWSSSTSRKQCHHLPPLFLENSQGLHLTLEFDRTTALGSSSLIHSSVDNNLLLHMSKIRVLKLWQPPYAWFSHLNKLSRLEEFDFDYGVLPSLSHRHPEFERHPNYQVLYLNKCASLRRLSLCGTESRREFKLYCRIPQTLIILHLSNMPIDSALKIVSRCPNLTELKLEQLGDPHEGESIPLWFGQSVKLGRLKSLTWGRRPSLSDTRWLDAFLAHVDVPALSKLETIDRIHNAVRSSPKELDFFQRISSNIHSLRFTESACLDIPGYVRFFTPDSPVERLDLVDCHYRVFNQVVRALTPHSKGKSMPWLQSLYVSGSNEFELFDVVPIPFNVELGPECLAPLTRMLERRLAAGDTFSLKLDDALVEWTYGLQERLRALIRKGVRLEIIEDGDPVDWLKD